MSTLRLLALGAILSVAAGCSGSTSDASTAKPKGTVGAHVWFGSSTGITLQESWFHDTWGPDAGAPDSGSRCWTITRDALTSAERDLLEKLVLVPLVNDCTSDGYQYFELDVSDSDGSAAAYRTTGCKDLQLADAKAQLSADAFFLSTCDDAGCVQDRVFPIADSAACPL